MHDSLKKLLSKIEKPLLYEPKNGYKDLTVMGGFSKFALALVMDALHQNPDEESKAYLMQWASLLSAYQENPCQSTYQSLFRLLSESKKKRSYPYQKLSPSACTSWIAARNELTKPVQYISGVGPKRSMQLQRLGIFTLYDLLFYFPRDYLDRSSIEEIGRARKDTVQTFLGKIAKVQESNVNRYLILKVIVFDKTGMMILVFFNQKYLKKVFEENLGKQIIFSGKVDFRYQYYEINSPEYEIMEEDKESIQTGRIVPVYRLTSGISPKWFRQLVWKTLQQNRQYIYDYLPGDLVQRNGWLSRQDSITSLHYPDSMNRIEQARQRMVFDEFLLGQFLCNKKKQEWHHLSSRSFSAATEDLVPFFQSVPFTFTNTQMVAVEEMISDINSEHPMNRLLHGDVGSGKTIVAAAMLYLAFKKGYQSAFMAPTEILARQSYQVMENVLAPLSAKVSLLISDMKEKEKKGVLRLIEDHETDIVIGTHAILQENVSFQKLGLIVVDEQHRFGVLQRSMLREKGFWPHTLVMSATPIPRTIAMTRFGDLDVSVLAEMPGGARKVITTILPRSQQEEAYHAVQAELNNGGKAFIVCPLVEESSKIQAENSIQKAEEMKQRFPDNEVFLLHGRMTAEEKEKIMDDFKNRPSSLLVSTTVVEVGIDIPEASSIVIENADRFGLAQLHQLRGRVGRKSQLSYCWLLVENINAKDKLSILEKTNSGFSIAEEDLKQRGPGELFGEKQSGFFSQTMIQLDKDAPLLEKAKEVISSLEQSSVFWADLEEETAFRKPFLEKRNLQDIG